MVQSVARALGLLEQLDQAAPGGLALSELAAAEGLKSPTARNLLQTLVELEYVAQAADTRRYRLGPAARSLGQPQSVKARLIQAARAIVVQAQRAVGETVLLALYDDGRRHTLVTAVSEQPLRVGAEVGVDDHLYTTATGRMLLARLPSSELKKVLHRLGPPADRWSEAADPEDFYAAIGGIREAGFARYQRPEAQIMALAVPVLLPDPKLKAALGLYLPVSRYQSQREPELLSALRQAAAEIAAEYRGWYHE